MNMHCLSQTRVPQHVVRDATLIQEPRCARDEVAAATMGNAVKPHLVIGAQRRHRGQRPRHASCGAQRGRCAMRRAQ
jgi:hypothetical protein